MRCYKILYIIMSQIFTITVIMNGHIVSSDAFAAFAFVPFLVSRKMKYFFSHLIKVVTADLKTSEFRKGRSLHSDKRKIRFRGHLHYL